MSDPLISTYQPGDRIKVVHVLPAWDAIHHRLGTCGIVLDVYDNAYGRAILVRHADGQEWEYAPLSIEKVGDPVLVS